MWFLDTTSENIAHHVIASGPIRIGYFHLRYNTIYRCALDGGDLIMVMSLCDYGYVITVMCSLLCDYSYVLPNFLVIIPSIPRFGVVFDYWAA